MDECTQLDGADGALHDCDANATCYNTPGSFICVCKDGFNGDGRSCNCKYTSLLTCFGATPFLNHVDFPLDKLASCWQVCHRPSAV